MPKTSSDDPFVRLVQNAAHHCANVMTEGAPCVYRCGIAGTVYRVTIEPRRVSDDPKIEAEDESHYPTTRFSNGKTANVWDQVWIALPGDADDDKGTWCGNRCGGRETLAALYADETLAALYADEIKAAALAEPMPA